MCIREFNHLNLYGFKVLSNTNKPKKIPAMASETSNSSNVISPIENVSKSYMNSNSSVMPIAGQNLNGKNYLQLFQSVSCSSGVRKR